MNSALHSRLADSKALRAIGSGVLTAALVAACGGGGGGSAAPASPTGQRPSDLSSSACNVQVIPAAGFLGASSAFSGAAPGAAVSTPLAGAVTFGGLCVVSAAASDATGAIVQRTLRLSGVALTNNAMGAGSEYVATLKYEERNAAGAIVREYLTSGDHSLRLIYADGKSYRFTLNSALLPNPRVGGGLQMTGSFDIVNP